MKGGIAASHIDASQGVSDWCITHRKGMSGVRLCSMWTDATCISSHILRVPSASSLSHAE